MKMHDTASAAITATRALYYHPLIHSLTYSVSFAPPPPLPRPSPLQVLILPDFNDFPSEAITVEFWMNSIDTCRPGVPFSYAHGEYEKQDNSFLIFNYNSFGVSDRADI